MSGIGKPPKISTVGKMASNHSSDDIDGIGRYLGQRGGVDGVLGQDIVQDVLGCMRGCIRLHGCDCCTCCTILTYVCNSFVLDRETTSTCQFIMEIKQISTVWLISDWISTNDVRRNIRTNAYHNRSAFIIS